MGLIKDLDPIFICGMPRSGTSMVRDLFNSINEALVLNGEPKLSLLKKYLEFFDAVEGEVKNSSGKFSEKLWSENKSAFSFFCLYLIDKYPKRVLDVSDYKYFVSKSPSFEFYMDDLNKMFSQKRPKYIYCTRRPDKVWESLRNMPWNNRQVGGFVSRYLKSHKKIVEIFEKEGGDNIAIFDLDRYIEAEDKFSYVKKVFQKIDVFVDDSLEEQVLKTKNGNSSKAKGYYKEVSSEVAKEIDVILKDNRLKEVKKLYPFG